MRPLETPEGKRLFRKGLELYRRGHYWHAHEAWEDLWRASPEPDRTFLKALIQIAAAMIHTEKGHWRGVRELLERVDRFLAPLPDRMAELDLRDLRAQVRKALQKARALETDAPHPSPSGLHISLKPLEGSDPSPDP